MSNKTTPKEDNKEGEEEEDEDDAFLNEIADIVMEAEKEQSAK